MAAERPSNFPVAHNGLSLINSQPEEAENFPPFLQWVWIEQLSNCMRDDPINGHNPPLFPPPTIFIVIDSIAIRPGP